MKVVCAWCRREGRPAILGEREPFDDPGETHGICGRHRRQVLYALPSRSFPEVRLLLVVSPKEAGLYQYLQRTFVGLREVKVIVERRASDRRCQRHPVAEERRHGDRRLLRGEVSALGYTAVRLGARPG